MTTATQIFQALADPTRWEIVRLLADGPCCVCELLVRLDMPQSTLSTHLQVLRASGLLLAERRGRWMYYGITRTARPLLKTLWKHFPQTASLAPIPVRNQDCRQNLTYVKNRPKPATIS